MRGKRHLTGGGLTRVPCASSNGHDPAALNLGNCIAYAFALETAEPFPYEGNDLAVTDISAAMPPAHGLPGTSGRQGAQAAKGHLINRMSIAAHPRTSPLHEPA